MTTPIFQEIENDIKSNKILLFMKGTKQVPQCGFSGQVVSILNSLGVQYDTRDILENAELRQAIKEYSNWPTLPQLYINGEFVGGCDIVTELYENGELAQLVAE